MNSKHGHSPSLTGAMPAPFWPAIRLAPRPGVECQQTTGETTVAKSQMKGNKEAKKPKADKPKSGGSAYKLAQGAGGPAANPPTKREWSRARREPPSLGD